MPRTVLLADDSVTIRKIVEITFGDTDMRVVCVASGREALERFDELRPDVVIADVVMPGPSGYEVCERVKASARPVPVLLLAGTFEPFDAERARSCGADGHLVKPFESRALLARVEDLLARASRTTPAPIPAPRDSDVEALLEEAAALALPSAGKEATAPPRALEDPATRSEPPSVEVALPAEAEEESASSEAPIRAEAAVAPVAAAIPAGLPPDAIEALVREVVRRLSEDAVREIAWEVVPDLAEVLIKERLREIESAERRRG